MRPIATFFLLHVGRFESTYRYVWMLLLFGHLLNVDGSNIKHECALFLTFHHILFPLRIEWESTFGIVMHIAQCSTTKFWCQKLGTRKTREWVRQMLANQFSLTYNISTLLPLPQIKWTSFELHTGNRIYYLLVHLHCEIWFVYIGATHTVIQFNSVRLQFTISITVSFSLCTSLGQLHTYMHCNEIIL